VFTIKPESVDGDRFEIKDNELTLLNPNFEEQQTFEVILEVEDQTGLTYQKTFEIKVLDINEPPVGISLETDVLLDAKTEIGTVVGTLSTQDEDSGDTFVYNLTGESEFFAILDDQLVTKNNFNFLIEETFQIGVVSTDLGGLSVADSFEIVVLAIPLSASVKLPVEIFPNPVENEFSITLGVDATFEIFTLTGAKLRSEAFSKGTHVVDVKGLKKGVYVVHLLSNQREEYIRFIKQ